MTWKQQFIHFLKQNNIYEQYIDNFDLEYSVTWDKCWEKTLKNFFEKMPPDQFINYSFNWAKTKEGSYFWADIDIKWRKELIRKIKKYGIT